MTSKLSGTCLLNVDVKNLSAAMTDIVIECQGLKGGGTLARTEAGVLLSECVGENPPFIQILNFS